MSFTDESPVPTLLNLTNSEPQHLYEENGVQTEPILTANSPRKVILKKKVNKLQSVVRNLKKKKQFCSNCNQRSPYSYNLLNTAKDYMPEHVFSFFESQVKLFKQKHQGRRYPEKLKPLFLSIYFYSPWTYRFLSTYFLLFHTILHFLGG